MPFSRYRFGPESAHEVLTSIYGMSEMEANIYIYLLDNSPATSKTIAQQFDRSLSTISIYLHRLLARGMIVRRHQGRKPEGYQYIYEIPNPKTIKLLLKEDIRLVRSHFQELALRVTSEEPDDDRA